MRNSKKLILVSLFAALTAVGAFIKIDIPIVPFSMQFFFCAMAGILLGSKAGALSQLIYVCIGLAGFPVFTSGGGFTYIYKPTFGFLIGLIFAAYVIGFIIEKAKTASVLTYIVAIFAGLFVLYLIGIPYVYYILKLYLKVPKSIGYLVSAYCIPYLGGDILKSVLVTLLCIRLKKFKQIFD
jgi:biotin transport system substrate-specific component